MLLDVGDSWASSTGVRTCMQANKARDTKPELALRSAVHSLGLRYRVSAQPLKGLRRTADLVFRKARVAVFLDGCFWHGCPEHHTVAVRNASFWADKVRTNQDRDRDTDSRLEEAGWLILRIWEHDDPTVAALTIHRAVLERLSADE
jgi:DNA mismatch endonuclease (patch repair protein)